VNVHGGFLLGFVLLGIYFLSAVWQRLRLQENSFEDVLQKIRAGNRAGNLALAVALSAIATLVNPYGWKLHLHIYRYLSNRFLMDHIDEFQSPNFHGIAQKCFAILLLLALVTLASRRRGTRNIPISQPLILLFAVYSGLYASRNIPVSAILITLVIGPQLSNAIQNLMRRRAGRQFAIHNSQFATPPFFSRMQTVDSGLRGHLWPLATVLLTCWVAFHGGRVGATPLIDAHFDPKRFPVEAVDYLQENNPHLPIFAPDSWGGYLIYRLYPQNKVVLDDRHDFYGGQFLKSYLKTIHVEPGWQDFLSTNDVRCIVIPRDSSLASILLETPGWQSMYSDSVAAVFSMKSPSKPAAKPQPASPWPANPTSPEKLQNPSH
jgi:hypothetical protein